MTTQGFILYCLEQSPVLLGAVFTMLATYWLVSVFFD